MLSFLSRRALPGLAAFALSFPASAATALADAAPLRMRIAVLEGGAAPALDNQAFLPLGALSATPGGNRLAAIVRRERVSVRIDGSAPHVRLSVALAADMPGCEVRVDGRTISSIPRIVDPVHRVGATVVHEIEITFDAGVPAGSFLSNLQWTAESD
jgi:hypothetical protein